MPKLVAFTKGTPQDEAVVKKVRNMCKRAKSPCKDMEVKPIGSEFKKDEIDQFEKSTGESASPIFCIKDEQTNETLQCTMKMRDLRRVIKEGVV